MRLQRTVTGTNGSPTLGKLTSRDGKFMCYTLERPGDGDHPCIAAGTYKVGIDWHHPGTAATYRCPELLDVPGRSQIQIHIANRCGELQGCIAPGERIGNDCVEDSGAAFRRLMKYLEDAALPFALEIVDP